jgi:hypothetical protein
MIVLNPFVEHNEPRFNKFLNDICEVGDFYEALEVFTVDVDGTVCRLIEKGN